MTGMSKQIGGIEPRNYKGRTIGWTAYYANPIDGGRVRRYFHDRDDAQDWLDGERLLVKAHKRGRKQWTHPRDRERKKKGATMPFKDFAEEWFDKRGRFDRHDPTKPLAPNTLRHKRLQLDRVERTFGNTPLGDITERMVADWLRDLDLDPIPKRETFIMLRAVMQAAAHPTDDRPLIDHNPCTQPVPPKPRSKRETIPELTPQQIAAVRDHMPDYTRVSINVMLGLGLRIGENVRPTCRRPGLGAWHLPSHPFDTTRRRRHRRSRIGRHEDRHESTGCAHSRPAHSRTRKTHRTVFRRLTRRNAAAPRTHKHHERSYVARPKSAKRWRRRDVRTRHRTSCAPRPSA